MTVPFREISNYVQIPTGRVTLKAFNPDGDRVQAARQFFVQPGQFYTFAITGVVVGPSGMLISNALPFVYMENMQPPNLGKFCGKWYHCSDTTAVIDLRVAHPSTPDLDEAHLTILNPKTVMEYPELSAGVYSFNPTLIKSYSPLVNPHTTNLAGGNSTPLLPLPPGEGFPLILIPLFSDVEITNAMIATGAIYDIFALSAALSTPDVNSLCLGYSVNYPRYEATTSCLIL